MIAFCKESFIKKNKISPLCPNHEICSRLYALQGFAKRSITEIFTDPQNGLNPVNRCVIEKLTAFDTIIAKNFLSRSNHWGDML